MVMKNLRFSDDAYDGDCIECPECGSFHTHHDLVQIFDRGEDAAVGMYVEVQTGPRLDDPPPVERPLGAITRQNSIMFSGRYSGPEFDGELNPSRRRHGLRIWFWCENCWGYFGLALAQHKGHSFLVWDRMVPFDDNLTPLDGHGHRQLIEVDGEVRCVDCGEVAEFDDCASTERS